jgi:hypothetical protein
MEMKAVRLALLVYTPTPLDVPVYRLLELDRRVDFTVIFCSDAGLRPADMGYGLPVTWGSELLSGYKSLFLRRARKNPGIGNRGVRGFFAYRDFDVIPKVLREQFDVLLLHGYNHLTHQLASAAQRTRGGEVMVRESRL